MNGSRSRWIGHPVLLYWKWSWNFCRYRDRQVGNHVSRRQVTTVDSLSAHEVALVASRHFHRVTYLGSPSNLAPSCHGLHDTNYNKRTSCKSRVEPELPQSHNWRRRIGSVPRGKIVYTIIVMTSVSCCCTAVCYIGLSEDNHLMNTVCSI